MDKYHVHVYMIQGLSEVDVNACDPVQAKELALEQVKGLSFGKSDCNYITVAFLEKE